MSAKTLLNTLADALRDIHAGSAAAGRYLDPRGHECAKEDQDATWTPYDQEEQAAWLSGVASTTERTLSSFDEAKAGAGVPTAAESRNIAESSDQALAAIRARLNGEFDHPALQAYGPLADTFSDVIRISEDALRQQYHAAPAKPKLEGRSVGPMLGISRSSQNYDGEDERAEAVYEQQMRDRADQAIESTVCDLIEPRIMAEFSQQAWNDHDEAVTLCTDQFDATDYVLAMPLEEIQQLA